MKRFQKRSHSSLLRSSLLLLSVLFLFSCLLSGCDTQASADPVEHSANAAMATALETTVFHPDGAGGLIAEEKILPWEHDMPAYVLSFVLDDASVAYDCAAENGLATVNISHFPVFEDAASEQSAVNAILSTLFLLPKINGVQLLFEGEKLVALKHGTPVSEPFFPNA